MTEQRGTPNDPIRLRTYLSLSHLWSAAYLATLADSVEIEWESRFGGQDHPLLAPYLAFVCSSIFASAAFVDGQINEVLSDAFDGTSDQIAVGDKHLAALADMWRNDVIRKHSPTLSKYQEAVRRCGGAPFDNGADPYISARLMLLLRNRLVHPEAEWGQPWTDTELRRLAEAGDEEEPTWEHGDLEAALADRFAWNPMTILPPNAFPIRILSRDCAEWCLSSAVAFVDAFFDRIGARPPYESHREHLETHMYKPDDHGGPYATGWI
jgi:hypothetical protein